MSRKLTASVVGAGVGGKLSMTALSRSDKFELKAAADLRPEALIALTTLYPGIRTYTDHRRMFEDCPTDVVCVSTYAPSHEAIAYDALSHPIQGILVEKPLADTYAAGERIINAVKAKKIPMATPHNLLAMSAPHAVIAGVRRGLIGDLALVEIECSGWDILNAGIHWANYFVALTGNERIATVHSALDTTGRTVRDGMQVETAGITYVETVSGIRMVMQTGDYVKVPGWDGGTLFRIVGSKGQIRMAAWANEYWLQNENYPSGHTFKPESPDTTGHQRHLETLAEEIVSGNLDYSVPESSLIALEICEAAFLSASKKVQVRSPLASFRPTPVSDWQPGIPAA